MPLVLDASIAVSWCFEDEATPATDQLFEQIQEDGASVPPLWHLEIGNILIQAERRKRITQAQGQRFLSLVNDLSLTTEEQPVEILQGDVIKIARMHKLTTYDAAYLELAMRLGATLASRDQSLCQAARKIGVKTLPD